MRRCRHLRASLRPLVPACLSSHRLPTQLPTCLPAAFPTRTLGNLSFEGQALSGKVPDEWSSDGAFPALQFLWLKGNRLSGPLPSKLGTQKAGPDLRYMWVLSAARSPVALCCRGPLAADSCSL